MALRSAVRAFPLVRPGHHGLSLVPKLCLGTHFRETLFREPQSRALQDVCSQAGAWEQAKLGRSGSRLTPVKYGCSIHRSRQAGA